MLEVLTALMEDRMDPGRLKKNFDFSKMERVDCSF